jgi:hypothetical protein
VALNQRPRVPGPWRTRPDLQERGAGSSPAAKATIVVAVPLSRDPSSTAPQLRRSCWCARGFPTRSAPFLTSAGGRSESVHGTWAAAQSDSCLATGFDLVPRTCTTQWRGPRHPESPPAVPEPARRSVPFPSLLLEPLKRRCAGRAGEDLVFTGTDGGVLRGTDFRPRHSEPAIERLQARDPDFPRITVHDLRHAAASLAISAGATVKAVQRMLGHASAAMTLDVSADRFDDDLDSVAQAPDRSARTAAQLEAPNKRRTPGGPGVLAGGSDRRRSGDLSIFSRLEGVLRGGARAPEPRRYADVGSFGSNRITWNLVRLWPKCGHWELGARAARTVQGTMDGA